MHPGLLRPPAEEASVLLDDGQVLRPGGGNVLARLDDPPERQVLVRHAASLLQGQMRVPGGNASPAFPVQFEPPAPGPLQGAQGSGLGGVPGADPKWNVHFRPLAEARPVFIPVNGDGKGAGRLQEEAHRTPGTEKFAPARSRRPARGRNWLQLVQPRSAGGRVALGMEMVPDALQARTKRGVGHPNPRQGHDPVVRDLELRVKLAASQGVLREDQTRVGPKAA